MYAVTSTWLVSLTRATLRSAEFGFFGVVVYTRVQTPRRCGLCLSAGVLFFDTLSWRPLRTSCWIVGNRVSVFPSYSYVRSMRARTALALEPGRPQNETRKSPVSRRFDPSDLRVFSSRRPPRSGVSRSASGQWQSPSSRTDLNHLDCERRESTRPAAQLPRNPALRPVASLPTGTQVPAQ